MFIYVRILTSSQAFTVINSIVAFSRFASIAINQLRMHQVYIQVSARGAFSIRAR